MVELVRYRNALFGLNLIGRYPDGIGFGNVSHKIPEGFLISASQTGHIAQCSNEHFALVTKYGITENFVECRGELPASSESLTHAMIYEVFPDAQAVIHVHNNGHWQRLQNQVPTSLANVPYGTPQMAAEIRRLATQSDLSTEKVLVMAGHEDGILFFGSSLAQTANILCQNLGLDSISLVS